MPPPANDNVAPSLLIPNWRATLKHAWSVRLDIFGMVLISLEFALQAFVAEPPISRMAFAAVGMVITFMSLAVRFIRQCKVSGPPCE